MNTQDYTNIYNGKTNILDPTRTVIQLQDHQKKFIEGYLLGNLKSAIVFHGVGTGKTFSAVAVMKVYFFIAVVLNDLKNIDLNIARICELV